MNKVCFLVSVASTLAFVSLSTISGLAQSSDQQEVQELSDARTWWEAMTVGWEEHLRKLQCVVAYEMWTAQAASREDALVGRYLAPARLEEKIRYAKREGVSTATVQFVGLANDIREGRYTSRDEVATVGGIDSCREEGFYFNVVETVKIKPPGEPVASCQIFVVEAQPGEFLPSTVLAVGPLGRSMKPIFCGGLTGGSRNVSPRWIDELGRRPGGDVRMRAFRQGNIIFFRVDLTTDQGKYCFEWDVRYDISGKYPLPVSFAVAYLGSNARYDTPVSDDQKTVNQFLDYVPVASGHLPRRVLILGASRPPTGRATGRQTQLWRVQEWKATEISDRSPRDEDFDIRVPSYVRVPSCLKPDRVPPIRDGYRTYNLTRLTLHDLKPECLQGRTIPRPSGWWRLVVLAGILLVGTGVGLIVFFRRRRK